MNGITLLLVLLVPAGTGGHGPPASPLDLSGPLALSDTLTLSAAIRDAVELHPAIGLTRERTAEAEAEILQARAARLPTVGLGAELTHHELPMVVAPLHAFDPAAAPEFSDTLLRSRLDLSWRLFDGGRSGALIGAGEAGREAALAASDDATARTIEQTAAVYLQVATGRLLVAAHEERAQALGAELERVERLLAEGRAAEVERLRAVAGLREAEAETATARARLRAVEGALGRLVGRTPEEIAALEVPVAALDGAAIGTAGPDARARAQAPAPPDPPALAAARARVRTAEATHRAVRSARLPRLDAVAGLSQFGGRGSSTTAEWDAGVRLSWPVFTGGRQSGAEDAAAARIRQAREDLHRIERELANETDQARAALEEALARRDALHIAEEAFAEVARIEALSLEVGTGVQRDFFDAQAGLLRTRAALAQAEAAVTTARISLARTLGHLSLAWILDSLEAER